MMSSSVDTPKEEVLNRDYQSAICSLANTSDENLELQKEEVGVEEEEDEEEDVDFHPSLVGENLSEASSSLSSDDEGLTDNVDAISEKALNCPGTDASTGPTGEMWNCCRDLANDYGEVVMQTRSPLDGDNVDAVVRGNPKKKRRLSSDDQHGKDVVTSKGLSLSCAMDAVEHTAEEESFVQNVSPSLSSRIPTNPIAEIDDEDAICRRTRARHSLANYTLEDLEMFLQESDDDGNPQNADEEEEYRRFLAAVLVGGDNDMPTGEGNEILDEDEENDADFEIEIEEALESDVDESVNCIDKNGIHVRRPETRQKNSLKDCAKKKEKLLGQAKMPLRPLLPSVSNAQVAAFSSLGRSKPFAGIVPHSSSPSSTFDVAYGFTAQQVGQLYCLIHEHVQLLIQVHSLSVLDPSRQHIASLVQKMISEMVDKREEALAWRKVPYPVSFSGPRCVQSSVPGDPHQIANGSPWTPVMSSPIVSVLDVASLSLARGYMTDVSASVSDFRRSQVDAVHDRNYLSKEPLFPLPSSTHFCETSYEVLGEGTTSCQNKISPQSACQTQHKKSLAATIVESTKKQSVALVPKGIAKLMQRFFSLFNSALFPHKPPRPPIANRVLFTDAEDGLLAMGIMEYNNDWASIRQRFLPCKSEHQIFVRQKNRSSSKASENPIKAVRRMKTSPLTADEKALIYEGLRVFKHDWISLCKCFVPHRDPSLLPRQWRIATGTQKSYRKDESMNEKRRLYEAKRRMFKAAMNHQKSLSEKEVDDSEENNADDYMDGEDEAYVHEAFLADMEPESSDHMPLELPSSSISKNKMQSAFSELSFQQIPRDFRNNANSAPYHTYNTTAPKVVKLAPDLPPVNLPSSVRVIPQSAFKSYSNKHKSMLSHIGAKNDHTHDPRTPQDHCVTLESNPVFDLQMHPLLFQATEDGCPPCLPINCDQTTSSSFNTFSGHPLKANLNLPLKHQLSASVAACPQVPHLKEVSLTSHTIDFHPLLQRTVNGDTVLSPDGDLSESEPLRSGRANHFNSLDCRLVEPRVIGGQSTANIESISQHEKANELDLDIHLYSTTNRGKTMKGRKITDNSNIGSRNISGLGNRRVEKAHDAYVLSQGAEKHQKNANATTSTEYAVKDVVSNPKANGCPEACITNSLELAFPKRGADKSTEDNFADQTFPEIVMEQEELSDSDEEFENVEFECEEIDDSEGEGLDGEQPPENINQEFLPTDKEDTDEDLDGQHRPRLHKSGSTGKGENSVLRIDSFPGNMELQNPKPESISRVRNHKVQIMGLHSHPCRSSNKQNKKRGQKRHSLETSQLNKYNGSEWNIVASRKPRRHLEK